MHIVKIMQEVMHEKLKYIYNFSETPFIMWKVSLNAILLHFYEQKSLFKTHPCVQIYFSLTRPEKKRGQKLPISKPENFLQPNNKTRTTFILLAAS